MPNIIKIFINWSNYLIYEYLGLSWYAALALAVLIYLISAIFEKCLKLMKKSENKVMKKLTAELFLQKSEND